MDLLTLQQKQYISLQGKHSNLEVKCPASVKTPLTHFQVMWFLESTKVYTFTFIRRNSCYRSKIFCLDVTSHQKSKIEYWIIGKIKPLVDRSSSYEKENKYSWLIANGICVRSGGRLPYFKNSDELD